MELCVCVCVTMFLAALHTYQNKFAATDIVIITQLLNFWEYEDEELNNNFLFLINTAGHSNPILCEEWISRYDDYEFFRSFRMNKDTFQQLFREINNENLGLDLNKPFHGGHKPISGDTQLLITLAWLGHGDIFFDLKRKFNIGEKTAFTFTETILERILLLKNKYVRWPQQHEMPYVSELFENICGYPGVIGAIDCTNVKIKISEEQQAVYIDKNMNHSIKVQAVVTANKLFTNICVGWPGSVHDARVFRNSNLFIDIAVQNNMNKYFPLNNYHLLGDKAYPILQWLLTPYKNYGNLTQRERRHNVKHSQTRIVVEHQFGYLKPRWKILKYVNVNSVIKAIKVITACCILHNFCYINKDEWYEPEFEEIEDLDNEGVHENPGNNQLGVMKRYNISLRF